MFLKSMNHIPDMHGRIHDRIIGQKLEDADHETIRLRCMRWEDTGVDRRRQRASRSRSPQPSDRLPIA